MLMPFPQGRKIYKPTLWALLGDETVDLASFVAHDPDNYLVFLRKKIPWYRLDKILREQCGYSETKGRRAISTQMMLGIHIFKYLNNLSDREAIREFTCNPFVQYLCGRQTMEFKPPFTRQSMIGFRKRFEGGEEVLNRILGEVLAVAGLRSVDVEQIIIDSTCFEKNVRFPTDVRLIERAISYVWKFRKKYGVRMRRAYRKEMKKLSRTVRFDGRSKGNREAVEAAKARIRAILGILLRDFTRKYQGQKISLSQEDLQMLTRCGVVQAQVKGSRNKIYSLHEPQVVCVAKNKAGKKYEFGTKVTLAISKAGLIVGCVPFMHNPNDSKTVEAVVRNAEKVTGFKTVEAVGDRGYRQPKGAKDILGGRVRISIPEAGGANTPEEKAAAREKFGRRASIEPRIEHVKDDHRARRNYLHGRCGDVFNAMFSCIAFDLKKLVSWHEEEVRKKERRNMAAV